jgi:hypothetical protein
MPAIALTGTGNVTTATTSSGTSITVNKPANVADGDLLVCLVVNSLTSSTWTAPSGWTQAGGQNASRSSYLYYKSIPSAAAESASSYAWSYSGGSGRAAAVLARITGADASTPIDVTGSTTTSGTGSIVAPAATAVSAQALLLGCWWTMNSTTTIADISAPGSMTDVGGTSVAPSGSSDVLLTQEALSASGSTGTRTATVSPSAASGVGGWLVAIAPGSSAATASATTVARAATIATPTVSTGQGATVSATVVARAAAVPAPVVTTGTDGPDITSATTGSGTSVTAAKPSGVVDGDLLVALVYSSITGSTWTPPSGWTQRAGQNTSRTFHIFTKPIPTASSESATSYTWSWGASVGRGAVIVHRIPGIDLGDVVDAVGTATTSGTTSIVAPAVTTTTAPTLLIAGWSSNSSSTTVPAITPPAGHTTIATVDVAPAASTEIVLSTELVAAIGSTGTRTAAVSPSASSGVSGVMLALTLVSVPATPTPATIARAATVPVPTVQTGARVTGTTVASTATVPGPAAQTGATVTATMIARAVTVPAVETITATPSTALPSTIAVHADIPIMAGQVDAVVTPAAIAAPTTVATPTSSGSALAALDDLAGRATATGTAPALDTVSVYQADASDVPIGTTVRVHTPAGALRHPDTYVVTALADADGFTRITLHKPLPSLIAAGDYLQVVPTGRLVTIPTPAVGVGTTVAPATVAALAAVAEPDVYSVTVLTGPADVATWQAAWNAVPLSPSGEPGWLAGDGAWSVVHPDGLGALFAFGDTPVTDDTFTVQGFPRSSAVLWTNHHGLRLDTGVQDWLPASGDGSWYWPGAMLTTGTTLWVVATRQSPAPLGSDEPWIDAGRSIFQFTWDRGWQSPQLVGRPIDLGPEIGWGAGLAVGADNWVYILGSWSAGGPAHRLYLARTLDLDGTPATAWQFWTAGGWVTGAANLTDPVNLEPVLGDSPGVERGVSLHLDPAGTWHLASKAGGRLASDIAIWEATAPTGPWRQRTVGTAPHGTPAPADQTYGALAHYDLPRLADGQVLMSVSRNQENRSAGEYFDTPTWYRPLWSGADATITIVTPATVSAAAEILAPETAASRTAAVSTIARPAVIPTPAIGAGATAAVPAILAAAGVPDPAVAFGVSVAAVPVAVTAAVPTPGLDGGGTSSPTTIAAAVVVAAPAVLVDGGAYPATTTTAAAVPAPLVRTSATVDPTPVAGAAAVPAPATSTGSGGGVQPAAITSVTTVPAPTVVTIAVATPASITATAVVAFGPAGTSSTATPDPVGARTLIPPVRRAGRPSRRGYVVGAPQ